MYVASLEKKEIIRSQEFMPSEARLKFLKKNDYFRAYVGGQGGPGPRGPPWIRP